MTLKNRVLDFLYDMVGEGHIPVIKKGMVEKFERFVEKELADAEMNRAARKMTKEPEKLKPLPKEQEVLNQLPPDEDDSE